MKKLIALVLVLMLCLSMTGCGNKEVSNVESMIKALGTITLESEDAIVAAQAAYGALKEEDAKKVSNYADLEAAVETLKELQKQEALRLEAEIIEKEIEAATANVNENSIKIIEQLKKSLESEPDEVLALVKNLSAIEQAEEKISAIRVGKVMGMISSIGEVNLDKIEMLRDVVSEYDKLTAKEKKAVSNYNDLKNAVAKLKEIRTKAEKDTLAAMNEVKSKDNKYSFYFPKKWNPDIRKDGWGEKRTFALPYMSITEGTSLGIRIIASHVGKSIKFNKVTYTVNDETLVLEVEDSAVTREKSGSKYIEFFDVSLKKDQIPMLRKIAEASEVTVKFEGVGSDSIKLTDADKAVFKEIADAYDLFTR